MATNNCNDCCELIGLNIGISKEKIKALIAEMLGENPGGGDGDCCISYSLDEQWTGKYWIDGKKVYQKTLDIGAMPKPGRVGIPHGIQGMDNLVSLGGTTVQASTGSVLVLPYVTPDGTPSVSVSAIKDNIEIYSRYDFNTNGFYKAVVTLQYTCVDR